MHEAKRVFQKVATTQVLQNATNSAKLIRRTASQQMENVTQPNLCEGFGFTRDAGASAKKPGTFQVAWFFKSAVGPMRLLLEALHVLWNGSGGSGLAVFGACAKAEGCCYDGQQSNVFHSIWIL
jgi:hypothetical protein